ncbi:hypothetical protein BH11BAC3_BH11BAC3_07540 [soil metagenome]
MGYPASAALLLKALTNDENAWLSLQAKIAVDQFSLFAIILSDPVKDPEFYSHLQDDFSYYDRLTGNKLLFFSIVKEADKNKFGSSNKQFRLFNDTEAYKQNNAAEENTLFKLGYTCYLHIIWCEL